MLNDGSNYSLGILTIVVLNYMSFTILRITCYLRLLGLESGIRHVFCQFSGCNVWIMLHQLLYLAYSYLID